MKLIKTRVPNKQYLDLNSPITVTSLRILADRLEDDKVGALEYKQDYGGYSWYTTRKETPQEVVNREKKEEQAKMKRIEAAEKALRKRKDLLIKKATALGMKVIE